ncbi:hypothetical protein IE077_002812 [Cardiosporidium cionae]|uniref:Uncharacterized protein n=1 Tax=Cardiosporidium cionae TaxID=476202 RepID=A0ABQ7J9V9_9APIC|nr:hypothetical protein IE077_002812 [Cardiosporidium cionae]|eukprot:KAF8820791.1 hypothetical protein IE077_002812 [Cardiosporidium cionae]
MDGNYFSCLHCSTCRTAFETLEENNSFKTASILQNIFKTLADQYYYICRLRQCVIWMDNSAYFNENSPDTGRMQDVNKIAERILACKEELVALEIAANSKREAARAYYKKEIPHFKQWHMVGNSFVKLDSDAITSHLSTAQQNIRKTIVETREKRKIAAREMIRLQPTISEIPSGELQFLLKDTKPLKSDV